MRAEASASCFERWRVGIPVAGVPGKEDHSAQPAQKANLFPHPEPRGPRSQDQEAGQQGRGQGSVRAGGTPPIPFPPQGDQPGTGPEAGGGDADVLAEAHRQHRGHLLCLLHHFWHPGGAGVWGSGRGAAVSRSLRSGSPLGPWMMRPKRAPPLFQKGRSRDAFFQASGLGPLGRLGTSQRTGSLEGGPKGTRASERLLTCDSCRLLFHPLRALHSEYRCWHRPTVCSGIPALPSLLEWGGLQARPGDPGPRQLGQVSGVLAGRRVQTPDEAGSGGCRGNLASGPGRELGFGGNRAGAAYRIPQAPLGAPPPCLPEPLAPAVSAAG